MRIFSINGYTHNQKTKTFKGETKYLNRTSPVPGYASVDSYKNSYAIPYAHIDYSENVKNRPFASVEKTLNTYHSGITQEVYYADPEEIVTTAIKEKADYVVYDNKPPYPVAEGYISENYFGKLRHNFVKDFDEIRLYHYRLEMADAKTADQYRRNILANYDEKNSTEKLAYYNARINKSKENQRLAQTCIDIYNKGGDLRYKKETAEDAVSHINYKIAELNRRIDSEKRDIKINTETLNQKEKESLLADLNLKAYQKAEARNKILDKTSQNDNLKTLIAEAKAQTENLNNAKKELRDSIYKSKVFLAQAPGMIKILMAEKAVKEAFIEEVKAKLIPLFDELKTHYRVNNLLHR